MSSHHYRSLKSGASPKEIAAARAEWADYMRLRTRPVKACVKCNQRFRNTREFFACGKEGRLTSTCLKCMKEANGRLQGQIKGFWGVCPACEEQAQLVVDRQAPRPDTLAACICRRCLVVINTVASIGKVPPRAFADRVAQYVDWRRGEKAPDREAEG